MLNNKTIAVVIPAFNEEKQIKMVLDSIPAYIDRIIVINDSSQDHTAAIVQRYIDQDKVDYSNDLIKPTEIEKNIFNQADIIAQELIAKEKQKLIPCEIYNKTPEKNRVILINHHKNGGVGAAVANGYHWCKVNNIDCTAKVDGDGQMDPAELELICKPVIYEDIDYVKGNRLIHRSSKLIMPGIRYFGNSILSIMTKIASGYWQVSDTQTAFTAISKKSLHGINLDKLYKKYGYPNDMLVKLNIIYSSLKEVEIKPIYNVGEKSTMKIFKLIPRITFLLFKSFIKRLVVKYFLRDFHPLFLFYLLALILFIIDIPYFLELIRNFMHKGEVTADNWLIVFIFLTIASLQSLFFAMWMDIQDNQRLYKY
ncbi:MAG: glycosyltransferase, partial [Bacteroidetes bacterium]|nr:glycosyltransferase [Bacteroidota bacterium]